MNAPAPPPLRLLSLDDAGIGPDDVIVRPQSSTMLLVAVMALGMAGWSAWSAAQGGLHWFWAALIVLALGWTARMSFRRWRRTQSPGVWQMAIGPDRVLVRFRGVMGTGLPSSDVQVIEVPLASLESVRRMRRTVQQKSGDERQRLSYEYLDLRVKGRDLRPLQAVLAAEQWDAARSWFRQRDPTVAVTCDGVLRVETTFQGSATKPTLDEILRLLGKHVPREEDARENLDLTNPASLSPEERDDAVRAIGETNPHRAHLLARETQPDVPWAETEKQVARLIACPDPIAAPAEPEAAASATSASAQPTGPALPAPRLLRGDEVRFGPGDRVVRPRSRGWVTVLLFFGVAGLVAWRWYVGAMGWVLAAVLGVPAAFVGWMVLGMSLATLRRHSWLLCVGEDRVLVRFRSYLHHRFPATDPVVLELPMASLAGVRRTVQTRISPSSSGSGKRERRHTLLDLRVQGLDLGPLARALSRERGLSQEPFVYEHAPVTVDGDLVRVELSSRDESIRPAADEVLRLLAERVPREEDAAEVVETGGPRGRGRTIAAPAAPETRETQAALPES